MTSMTSITSETRQETLSIISDFWKEAYGSRPRGINFDAYSNEELDELWSELSAICSENASEEERQIAESWKAFNETITKTIGYGAGTRANALKWMFDGSGLCADNYQDIEHFVWQYGIMWHKEGRAIVDEVCDILHPNRHAA